MIEKQKLKRYSQIVNNKYYYPDHEREYYRWEVIKHRLCFDTLVILARYKSDYAVFSDMLVSRRHYPRDKFCGTLCDAYEMFREICLDEIISKYKQRLI